MQYDIGIPRTAANRAARGSKRKITASTPRTMSGSGAGPVDGNPAGAEYGNPHMQTHTLGSTSFDDSAVPLDDSMQHSETTKRKLKRPAKPAAALLDSDDGEGDGDDGELDQAGKKRARGRPRIDIKDVTAADRRRTQIRLAQRAYRNRKERAIVSLEKKVSSLKDANEAMSNAFMRLHDFAVGRGLLETNPDLATQFRQTTEVFLEMARQSSADEDEDEDEEGNIVPKEEHKDVLPTAAIAAHSTAQPMPSEHQPEQEAYQKRQRSIADAVMTFGYQTEQVVVDRRHSHMGHSHPQPEMAQQMMVPQMQQARQVHGQMYSNMPFHQHQQQHPHQHHQQQHHQQQNQHQHQHQHPQQHQPPHLSANSYVQPDGVVGSFGMAIGTLEAMGQSSSEPSVSGQPAYFGHIRTDGMNSLPSNGRSSNKSTVSVSPGSAVHNFDFTAQLGMVNSPMQPYPSYDSAAMPASTSEIAPHLADTQEFMRTAAIGSPSTLPLPTRYPIDVPFGLRLRRQAIQAAYNLITTPDPPPEVFSRVFGFCIMFEQPGQIRQRLRRGLEAPIYHNSKFNKWELPFVSQTPDPEGEAYARLPSRCQAPNNSNSDHRGTNVRPVVPQINITLPGFEGAFFDCEEIEMYLQQRGVHIPPNTHNVIVEVDDNDFTVGGTSTSTAGRGSNCSTGTSSVADNTFGAGAGPSPESSGRTGHVAPDLVPAKGANAMDWNMNGGPNIMGTIAAAAGRGTNSNNGMTDESAMMASIMTMHSFASFQTQGQGQHQSHSPMFPQRRLLTLDVDKFLQELVGRGSCLGQTPGFREADVNEAFWRSTQSAS